MLTVYIGWDPAEKQAFKVAERSCISNASQPVATIPLRAQDLYKWKYLWRPVERAQGRMVDHLSSAPQATEFAASRFLVPFLHRSGWALFMDCDMVVLGDIVDLFAHADPRYAVMCVKHQHEAGESQKMCGHAQTSYSRKNWSSVVLWNCDHPANQRLTLSMVNSLPGLLLHQFNWLRDDEIGELPGAWNWLVGVQEKPDDPKIAHFTLGGKWLPGWDERPHDDLWVQAAKELGIYHD